MDEDPEMSMQPVMRNMALIAMGDFLLFIGLIFLLWGIADFIGDFLKIKGSGFALIGLALLSIALILLFRSRQSIRIVPQVRKEEKKTRSEDYR